MCLISANLTEGYRDYATFDLTSVLLAARPERGYFSLSNAGKITVLSDGGSTFAEAEGGTHRYLILTEQQKEKTLEAMTMLVTQPAVKMSQRKAK